MTNFSSCNRLRIMHVHTFYEDYLKNFYARHRELKEASFNVISRALFKDGFSGIHMPAMYLTDCTTMLVISNDLISQCAWAVENGVNHTPQWQFDTLRAQIAAFRPDVLYLVNCIKYDAKFLRTLDTPIPLVAGWRAADVPYDTDWSGFGLILSGLPRLATLAKTLGAKQSALFYPGMPKWISEKVAEIPQTTDVVFAGGISPTQHGDRLCLLDTLAQAASCHGFSLALHLSCDSQMITPAMRPFLKPAVFGLDMHKALRRGRIVFDCQGNIGLLRPDGTRQLDLAGGDTANMRLFEATGGGSLLMTQALPGLARLFEPEKEVAVFTNREDLIRKIIFYLSNEAARYAVAKNGRSRCLQQWSMQGCSSTFRSLILSTLKGRDNT